MVLYFRVFVTLVVDGGEWSVSQPDRFARGKGFRYTLNRKFECRGRQPTVRLPSVARGTIFSGTLNELKYNNYEFIKKLNF
jgi:hypothetical protein